MTSFITTAILGVIICILGIINMSGNISSLHWYHRQRVTEENVKPFGRLVGIGTLIIGISVLLFSAMTFIFEISSAEVYVLIGTVVMILGLVVGIIISFYAMKKYNGGIF